MRTINWWEFDVEYDLPSFVNCKGSGGGGGSSGQISYPSYMETIHEAWLGSSGDVSLDLTSAIAAAHSNSPFDSVTAFDPATPLSNMATAVTTLTTAITNFDTDIAAFDTDIDTLDGNIDDYDTIVNTFDTMIAALVGGAGWSSGMSAAKASIDGYIDSGYIDDAVDGHSDYLKDEYDNNVIPEFESGMRDINAVMNSSFVLGRAYIVAMRARDVAKYRSDLSLSLHKQRNDLIVAAAQIYVNDVLGIAGLRGEAVKYTRDATVLRKELAELRHKVVSLDKDSTSFSKDVAMLDIEVNRLNIVANKEEADQNLAIDERDARWDLEVFSYGANMMAAIAGGTSSISPDQPSQTQSAIGGALAGAAIGAQVGGGYGAIVGGVIGLGASFL